MPSVTRIVHKPGVVPSLVAALLAAWIAGTSAARPDSDYRYKAAFVYGVIKFVEWPASALPAGSQPIRLAVLGEDALSAFEAAFAGKTAAGHPIEVRGYARAKDLGPCEVLFIAQEAAQQARDALLSIRGRAVLTVSEPLAPGTPPTIIRLDVVNTKLVFDASLQTARDSGLKLSSNLLRLARTVDGDGPATPAP